MGPNPLFREKKANSVAQYLRALKTLGQKRTRWFRGHSDARWKLIPSLVRSRKQWVSDEGLLMARFKQNALPLVPPGSRTDTEWDWLLLMQHHGAKTRLLDWTENPLAGLYFAVADPTKRDGCVWVLDPEGLNKKAALASTDPIPTLEDKSLQVYRPSELAQAVAGFTRPPVAVLAMRMFPRLVAQAGVFTLVHRVLTPLEDFEDGRYVGRILIPGSAKNTIRTDLYDIGVTRLALFPELESVAKHAMSFLK